MRVGNNTSSKLLRACARRGTIIVHMAVTLPVLILFGSLAVDWGRMQLAKTQVQTAAVASARAGGTDMINGSDMTTILADCISTARMNKIDGAPVTIRSGDIKLGIYFPDVKQFVETSDTTMANALRIDLTHQFGRDSSALSFIPIFDMTNRCVTAHTTIMIENANIDPNNYTYLLTTAGSSGGTPGTSTTTTTTTSGSTTTTTTDPGTVITEADASTIVSSWTPPPAPPPDPTPVFDTSTTTTASWIDTTTTTTYTPDTTWSTPDTTTTVTVTAPPPPPPPKKIVLVN